MRITPARIAGAFFVEVDPIADERGSFARTFCSSVFAENGLKSEFLQCNASYNPARGTLRGLHYQHAPHEETKLVRVTRGRIFDVAVDLRPQSPTYLAWDSVVLDWEQRNAFYIPGGCAHGFLTMEEQSEVFYQISYPYIPESARTVRWDDPAFGIEWPFEPSVIGEKDTTCEYYGERNRP